jgi:hypothetical protein
MHYDNRRRDAERQMEQTKDVAALARSTADVRCGTPISGPGPQPTRD